LTLNTGSSSLKAALYRMGEGERRLLAARAERIGSEESRLRLEDLREETIDERLVALPDHPAALRTLLDYLRTRGWDRDLAAVGHRVVHGGAHYGEPRLIDAEVTENLRGLAQIDPEHAPQALATIEAVARAYPTVPQVACFDTAFHSRKPRVARLYALPRRFAEAGVIRYGFHGLSCEYVMEELRAAGPAEADGRVVIAHLGNGASLTAVRGGVGLDTTMGFTPAGGLVMGTRSGDLDPGVLVHLLRSRGSGPGELGNLVNRESGLLGVSGTSADMRDLLEHEQDDPRAAEAVDLFCYQTKKSLGALVAALGGLDTLVFTGGIGENAAPVRWRTCEDLAFLGIRLDPDRNAAHASVISREDAAVTVRVVRTDENLMIARHTHRITTQGRTENVPF
jgi:acetate kinase